jgi:mRNA interferase MazF
VVLADVGRGDWILCQITSKPYGDAAAIRLEDSHFSKGSLRITSYARPGKLFTANKELLVSQVAELTAEAFEGIIEATVSILRAGLRR